MGVDATLFARAARRAVYLDRLHYWRLADPLDRDGPEALALYDKLRGTSKGDGKATAEDLIKLCEFLIEDELEACRGGMAPRNSKVWLWKACIAFAQEHPDDEFFIQSDHDDPTWWDIRDEGKYVVWDPYVTVAAPWQPDYVKPKYDPPTPLTPEEQAQRQEAVSALVRALESGHYDSLDTRPTKLSEPGCAGIIGGPLQVESLECTMRCVTFTLPSEPRTWRQTLQYINWHWLDLFTAGPRSFWWHARNHILPLKLNKDLSAFDKQQEPFEACGYHGEGVNREWRCIAPQDHGGPYQCREERRP
jgi:hypothetical protein